MGNLLVWIQRLTLVTFVVEVIRRVVTAIIHAIQTYIDAMRDASVDVNEPTGAQ